MTLTSTSGLGVSGLASGLDTASIITKLMTIESQPQTQLKSQLSTVTSFTSALQSLNSSVASIATAAQSAATAGALSSFTASSDTSGVTAVAGATASAGSISFQVGRTASAQVSVTDALVAWPDTSSSTPAITIQVGSGSAASTTTVTATSGSIDDVVAAINGGKTGVTATKVAAGQDSAGGALYRIQLRSASGAAGAFQVFEGTGTAGPALPATTVSTAADAALTLWPGTGAAQTVTSATNTFTGLLTGVDVTVSAATTSAATITVAADSSKASASASSLTSGLIALFSNLAAQTAITTTASSTGSTASTTGAVFTGDLAVRQLKDSMLAAASDPVNGTSLSTIGIGLTKDGTITFDQDAFTAAMAKDSVGTTAMFQAVATRVGAVATAVSAPYTGTLTTRISSEQSTESALTDQISDWDSRLATIKAGYESQYAALETAMSTLSSQASYLTSQIAGLTTTYS